jgi:hypothetical protein
MRTNMMEINFSIILHTICVCLFIGDKEYAAGIYEQRFNTIISYFLHSYKIYSLQRLSTGAV